MDNLETNTQNISPEPSLLVKYGPLLAQVSRFALVGLLNTGINFAVLNLLSSLTGITDGTRIIPITAIAFLVANVTGYFIHKKFTFKDNSSGEGAKKFSVYFSVSVIGAIINIAVVYLITTFIPPVFDLKPQSWLNVANLVATGFSLIWNFIGYKLIVFRGK